MKRLLAILFLCSTVSASTKFTTGNMTMSVLAPIPSDTVYVRAAHILTVDVNHVGTTCAAIVDSGKMIHLAGSRINVGGLRILGTDSLLAGSRLDIWNSGNLGADDIQLLGTGKFYAIGSTTSQAQIFGVAVGGVLPNWPVGVATTRLFLRRANIRGFQGTWPSAGLTITGMPPSQVSIRHCDFDSASISYRTTGGHLLYGSTFDYYAGMNRAIITLDSPNDTIMACRIRHNSLGGGAYTGAQGIYVASNNTLIYGCNIKDTNFTGQWGGDYGINMEQNRSGTKIIYDTVSGFMFTVATAGGNHPNVFIHGCKIQNGSHESIIIHNGDTNWKIRNSLITSFVAGGRATVVVYCSVTGGADGFEFLYNTVNSCWGGNPAAAALTFENTGSGNIIYNNIKVVGNILIGDNAGFNRAEIGFGTSSTQTSTVNFTEFKDNAFDSVWYSGAGSGATYPYSRLDSNLHNATSFIFVDSAAGDFRLGAGSPMKNAADSAYGCQVYGNFRAVSRPFNIGYDQNFYNRWAYAKYSPTGKTDSAWIRTGALTYSLTHAAVYPFLGRKYDVLINGGGAITTARIQDSMTKSLDYMTLTSIRSEDYNTMLPAFRSAYYPGVANIDSFGLKLGTTGGSVSITGQQSTCTGVLTVTSPGNVLKFCGWTEANRWCPDFRLPITQHYVAHKVTQRMGMLHDGIMQDEASVYKASKCCGSVQDQYGMFWPFTAGDWTPAGSFNLARGWEGRTYIQIRDSLIQLKRNVWGKRLEDTLHLYGFQNFGNYTVYSLPLTTEGDMSDPYGDARDIGTGHLTFENALAPYVYGPSWNSWAWKAMDSINVWDTAQMIIWTTIVPSESLSVAATGGWKRLQMERLVWYYMASSRKTIYCLSSNGGTPIDLRPNDYSVNDSLYKWTKACERNVGQPTGARYVAATGTDGAGQAYTLYRRNFTNAIMIYRGASGSPGNATATSAISYNIGQVGTPLDADNITGTQSSTASIRNMEGQIWFTDSPPQSAPFVKPLKHWRRL